MTPVLFDFETCSAADLRAIGGRNYAKHESTRVLIGCFLIDGVFHVWLPGQDIGLPCFADLWPRQFGAPRPVAMWNGVGLPSCVIDPAVQGREFTAHNCHNFDEWVWREKVRPVPVKFGDTIHACRAAGLPAKLDDLGKRFFGLGKDPGQTIMSRMWKLEYDPAREYFNKNQTPGNIAAAARYCIGDVVILEKVYAETLGFGEPNVINVHREINNRGVQLDTGLARQLIDFSNRHAKEAGQEIEHITGGALTEADLRSTAKMHKWLKANGVELGDLRKQTVDRLLDDPDSFLEELEDHE